MRIDKNLKVNTKAFLEIVSEMFSEWIPDLAGVGIQAVWAGYYTEPRYIVDPELGLFVGMPEYFEKLKLNGPGLSEKAFK